VGHHVGVDSDLIRTARLELRVIDRALIDGLLEDPAGVDRFSVPSGWPDPDGIAHLERWRALASGDGWRGRWRARALVDSSGTLVGHAGFHGPPVELAVALDDPTFVGRIDSCAGGVVEIGYTVLDSFRLQGFASEAVAGLIGWAGSTGDVAAVIACVRPDNAASLAVLDRLGGFEIIGSCRDGDDDELVFRLDLT
jgi:ribosomal-protein-alanine N-acetyltransferase